MKSIILYVLISLSLTAHSQHTFTPAEKSQLQNGELLVYEKDIDGKPWPESTYYTLINISPLASLSVFSDFVAQQNYIPRIAEAKEKEYKSPWDIHVAVKAEVPWPINETHYTTGNILERPDDNFYRLTWYLVDAEHFNDTYGYISFKPYGNKTLMVYNSLVDPKTSFLANLFKGKIRNETREVVEAIRDHLNSFQGKEESGYIKERESKVEAALTEKGN